MEKEFFFTWKDVKRLFLRKKKVYSCLFCLAFLFVLIFRLTSPPLYTATAIFKQASQESSNADLIRSFFQSPGLGSKESGVQTVLESRTLLKKVIQDLGLALEVLDSSVPLRWIQAAKDRIYTELGFPISERSSLQFSHAFFEIESSLDFYLKFLEEGSFEILNKSKQKIKEGIVGASIEVLGGSFTLVEAKNSMKGRLYKVRIHPMSELIKKTRATLEIKSSKKDKNILSLTYSSPNAKKAALFLNTLMASYQKYLKKENEEISSVQMEYLERRQGELMQKYEKSLEEHVAFLDKSLADTGFVSFKQEIELLEKPNEEYLSRLYDIDLRLSRLHPKKVSRDDQDESRGPAFQNCVEEKSSPNKTIHPSGLEKVLLEKEQQLRDAELCAQRKTKGEVAKWLEGISPEAAEKLSLEYNEQLESLRTTIEQLRHLQKQILIPDFEITSLSGILTDAVSQEMIQKAGRSVLEMQDKTNYSAKDLERIQEGIYVQKRFLLQHMTQLIEMHKLRAHLFEEKITSLQNTSEHLLQIEKKLIQNQLDSLQQRMKSLPEKWKRESQLLMQRDLSMGVVEGLTQLAESKNINHQLFHVESKPIDQAFVPYKASKCFLFGQCFFAGLFISGFVFAINFVRWLSKGRAITETSAKEFGVTFCGFLDELFHGSLNDLRSEDRETLRKVSSFISDCQRGKRSICISVLSKSSSFSEGIAALLKLKGLKVLLVECTPSAVNTKDSIGLYDYLLDKGAVFIAKEKNFDRISSGGYEGAFIELLFRKSFEKLLKESLSSYDVVLLTLNSNLSNALVTPLKDVSDAFVVHLRDVFYEEAALVLEGSSQKDVAVVLSF